MARGTRQQPTICWDCSKACGGCSWSDQFIPVSGWEAERTQVKLPTGAKREGSPEYIDSFIVASCPLFDRDARQYGMKWTNKANEIIRRGKNKEQ